MAWLVGRLLRPLIWLASLVAAVFMLSWVVLVGIVELARGIRQWISEARSLRNMTKSVVAEIFRGIEEQQMNTPLDQTKKTIFLLITCGQAVRNFLLSDVFDLLRERFNVVILSPYASDAEFRQRFGLPGVHVLPWFESFRSTLERFFLYYLMSQTGSATHENWLKNLELRAKRPSERRIRYLEHLAIRQLSNAIGGILGTKAMLALYHAYFLAYLPGSLFTRLFAAYRPALVFSTTAHHLEAWPLTYMARRYGAKSLANVLSWDNTSTKAAMDPHGDCYTVWSSEMKEELARFYPYIKAEVVITGSPLFDLYYNRRGALDRKTFLDSLGLPPDRPYILYTTNTPAGMPDEHKIVADYWRALRKTEFADKVGLLVRLHPKENEATYSELRDLENVALTVAGRPHWKSSDRWLPTDRDMQLLLNSMLHAAVSVNVASTMSLESFTLGLPTINVAFRSSPRQEERSLMWSFSMYHTSEHYRAIVENGAVDLARSLDELVEFTVKALRHGAQRTAEMQKTLEQKAAYCDGTAARRLVDVIEKIVDPRTAAQSRVNVRFAVEPTGDAVHARPAE